MSYLFALCPETPLVSPAELFRLAEALELNARHCAKAWGLEPPALAVIDDVDKLPESCQPIVFLDSDSETKTDFLAVHYVDPVRGGPAARVFCDRSSGFNTGRYSISELAAHEVVEALVDPRVNLWSDHPDPLREGVQVALEVADPTQTHYEVELGGTKWCVANFVTPAWFDGRLLPDETRQRFLRSGGKFDYRGELAKPGEIGPEGYAVMRSRSESKWRTWSEARGGAGDPRAAWSSAKREGSKHPWSRTRQRGAA